MLEQGLLLINMGGYASTVWPAYGCFMALIAFNRVHLWRMKQKLKQQSHVV